MRKLKTIKIFMATNGRMLKTVTHRENEKIHYLKKK